ncbi:hypothetical protein D3C87_1577870 [compost metagenome]
MPVGVADEAAKGFEKAQALSIIGAQQAARGHPVGRGGPVVDSADVLRVVRHQRHHADAASGRTVEAFDLQEHAPAFDEDARGGRGDARLRQGAQCQVLADEEVARAPVQGRRACERELDDDLPAIAHRAELRLFAAGRRAGQGALHRALRHGGVVAHGDSASGACAQRMKALEGFGTHHEVAGQVFAAQRERLQHVVVVPVLGVGR